MSSTSPTLVFVHAHPDDESIFTAGASMLYAERGVTVVLVTCTNGRLGIDASGRDGSQPGHDQVGTARNRDLELDRAASMIGVTRHVKLGFDDSGMVGWPTTEEPQSFVQASTTDVANTLTRLFDEVAADVVVTYDERGFYGHPDHIKAHDVTMAAVQRSTSVQRLYYPVIPTAAYAFVRTMAEELQLDLPAWFRTMRGTPDELVTTTPPTTPYSSRKHDAIRAHATQIDNRPIWEVDPGAFEVVLGQEWYQRGWSRVPATGDEHDLFGGI